MARPDYTELRPGPVELPPEQLSAVGQGWSKSLSRYLKAVRACLRRAPGPVKAISAGWDRPNPNSVGPCMRGPLDENWVQRGATLGGADLRRRTPEPLPAEGPLFYPDLTRPAGACGSRCSADEFDAPAGGSGRNARAGRRGPRQRADRDLAHPPQLRPLRRIASTYLSAATPCRQV
jgi:hypothetical protein